MKALERNSTWNIVDKAKDKRVVGCRWIYTVKCKSNGTLGIKRDWLQRDTHRPMTLTMRRYLPLRINLSLAAHFGWDLQQFNVKNVFLHENLEEEVYMEIPPRFESHSVKNKVCKLKKALYGLKQYPRAKDIFIFQRKYVLDLLKTRKLGCKITGVPIEQNHNIESEESPPVKKSQY
ncbi:hypothetical protein CR513_15706, partial [Mucuna pruriens]